MKRILVTGSRHWTDHLTISVALYNAWRDLGSEPDAVLVHGACHIGGADTIARDIWRSQGLADEPHPAEIVGGRVLGPARNQRMVDLGADVCLAFPLPDSRGTYDCMSRARKAGIPVVTHEPRTDACGRWGRIAPETTAVSWSTSEAETKRLAEVVARVEALADEWEEGSDEPPYPDTFYGIALRAALSGPVPDAEEREETAK